MFKPSALLMLNSGSSSVKFKIYTAKDALSLLADGVVKNLSSKPLFQAAIQGEETEKEFSAAMSQTDAIEIIWDFLNDCQENFDVIAVTHRIVHGGNIFTESIKITAEVLEELKKLIPLAPLHQPYNLEAVEFIKKIKPEIPQYACFDTAFHAQGTNLHTTFALPESIREQGVKKYGFHGLSYEWIAHYLNQYEPALAKRAIVAAHLGNGSSLCALSSGQSVETTMGMTALGGLPMGTRSGDLDPGVIIYMMRELNLSMNEIEEILYKKSGLLGLSSLTNDVKTLEKSDDEKAQFALDYYCLKVAQYIAMMAVAIGGLDGVIFTGGIGENSSRVRKKILTRLQFLTPFAVKVVPANEEKIMALHTITLLKARD